MSKNALTVIPIQAPVHQSAFNLSHTLLEAIAAADEHLQDGDVLAISSKYVAISEGRVIDMDDVIPSPRAEEMAARYNIEPRIAELVIREADHIFGGIQLGFLLTATHGVIAPNAGLDRSNIPNGKVVLLPAYPYRSAAEIRAALQAALNVNIGVVLTDSWLAPGRLGTMGIALATAGFRPVLDERGKSDLFGNPMRVTQRGIADSISVCAQMVMGERDEATPIAIVRNSGVQLEDVDVSVEDVAIPWPMCIYVESLTLGLLPDGAPDRPYSLELLKQNGHVAG